jgi:hypothetical protein
MDGFDCCPLAVMYLNQIRPSHHFGKKTWLVRYDSQRAAIAMTMTAAIVAMVAL